MNRAMNWVRRHFGNILDLFTAPSSGLRFPTENRTSATGPLRVHPENPRYFCDGSDRAVYLTGSHTWANLVDNSIDGAPVFDFDAYLDFLDKHHHNFIRLWTWEQAAWTQFTARKLTFDPHPYLRTGPGEALDGKPKFDVRQFNPTYFDRLRRRVAAAGERGIYVSVMLFQGFSIEQKETLGIDPRRGNPWNGHPFNEHNNVNGINGDLDGDGEGREVHTLSNPAVTELQEAYVRRVLDTLNDLDNVLYEISNESHVGSTQWQYHFIDLIHDYEAHKAKQHPVGMTCQKDVGKDPSGNKILFDGPADWISPGPEGVYRKNPPAAEGRKIVISDTDHLWGVGGTMEWIWKTFTRGQHPILMDPYRDLRKRVHPEIRKKPLRNRWWNPLRRNLGYTRWYADRMDLARMTPRGDLASTDYCLADPGREYLIYLPKGGEVTVNLEDTKGDLEVAWFNPHNGRLRASSSLKGGCTQTFHAPFRGQAVLHLVTRLSESR